MKIEIIDASSNDKLVIRNMMELYNYDLSEYENADLNEHGLYDYNYLDNYWTEEDRHPFIIRVDAKLAGFVLVNKHGVDTSFSIDYSIAEFFILKKYRKKGVGKAVAFNIFDRFHGVWEVKQLLDNKVSHVFWHEVIKEYTLNNFEELPKGTESWDGPIHRFNNNNKSFLK
ncbi:GNAT family N-acetyltransferase [Clostridium sp. UBA6640]|uniref:GNAT family N-acetyltransferase n=1 Tax=Clostridium sp. UBA6640 TaxID=1946370 RepID=UPI0025BD3963|nr:GNAT family N-acetyltransferase [Clostridium sp. UBA6640]